MRFPWNRTERELEREVAHHLRELTAEYERRGHSHHEALWMAKREFGGAEQIKEKCRDERRFSWTAGIWQDIAFAIRQIRRTPGFSLTAIVTLALGIAANVIVFGVLQALILRPLDVPHADKVMTLARTPRDYPVFSYPEVRDVRDQSTVFSAVAAWGIWNVGFEVNGITRPVWGLSVSGQYFEVAEIKPFLGRLLNRADDERAGASEAVVLAWPAWNSYFNADPNVLGKTVRLNKRPYTVVGVAPPNFYGTEKFLQPLFFAPMVDSPLMGEGDLESRRDQNVWSIVRIKDGVTKAQVQTELDAIAAGMARRYPKDEEKLTLTLTKPGLMGGFLGAPAGAFLAAVMGLAAIVLLAACANVGSLFAARTADRAREVAIRLAIGSSRWRIIRQLLVEALMIATLGGACACALAWLALTGLATWHPPTEYPMVFLVWPQPSILVMAFLTSLVAGALFGMMPLRQIFKTDPNDAIKNGGSQSLAGRRWALRDILLAAQIALCCVTVTAAFVSLRGLGKALTMDLGFNPKQAVVTRFELSQAGYVGDAAEHFQRELNERVLRIPGVIAAGYANSTPLNQDTSVFPVYSRETTDFRPSTKAFSVYGYDVSPGYFATAQTSLLAGRDVSFEDTKDTPPVAVVNQEFARRMFHSEDAVGKYFKVRSGSSIRIVGMVRDGKYLTLSEDQKAAAFFPITQETATKTSLVVRLTPEAPAAVTTELANTIRKLIRDRDPSIPIRESSGWNNQLGMTFFLSRIATAALGIFGAFGLLLSIAGTFGLASYTVSKRLRELSIRVAIGAGVKQILAASLGRMLILLVSGSLVGGLLGAGASRALAAIVYQASSQDPLVLTAVAATMLIAGTLAVVGPVRRVLRLEPATLLREQ